MEWDYFRQTHIASMWTVQKPDSFLKVTSGGAHRSSGPPSAAPSNAGLTGAFGHRLFEFRNKTRSVWLVRASFDGRPASRVAQETSGSWGAFLLVTYSLCKQRKVTRRKGEKQRPTTQHPRELPSKSSPKK